MSDGDFAERYGAWSVVAGASEGVGAEFARELGRRGVNVVLIARTEALLEEVAASIREASGVEARVAAIDLAQPDAIDKVRSATDGLEVGLLMYNAGADPNYEPFLAQPVENALWMIERNCVMPTRMCHHFAQPMVARGRGGIILVSSGAGLVGFPNVVSYCGTKAFDIIMGEALWSELRDHGVDVLSLVLGFTDTPAQRRVMVRHGLLEEGDVTTPIQGASTPEEVVAEALEHLSQGPTWITNPQLRELAADIATKTRADAVQTMIDMSTTVMEEDPAQA
jgi:uncharacterized protein